MTNNILVLGGSGFLGSEIVRTLIKNNFGNVTCGDFYRNERLKCKFLLINILDKDDAFKKINDFDIIINCLGAISNPFSRTLIINSDGMLNLSEIILKKNIPLFHISTISVYGSGNKISENSKLNPETNYGTAKAVAEKILLKNICKNNISIFRISNLYGPMQKKGILAYLIRSYRSDRNLIFDNDGSLKRSYIHVKDCANIIFQLIKRKFPKGIYNIKGNESYSIKELIKIFESHFNITYKISFSKNPPLGNIKSMDDSKVQSKLNYEFNFTIKDLINDLA